MPWLNRVQTRWTEAARWLARLVTFPIALAVVACQDGNRPTTSPPDQARAPRARASADETPTGSSVVLRGTIVTPNGVIKHGYVGIVGGRIVSVSDKQPDIPNATSVNTEGIIVPGFVDVHNHLPWNALPRWTPPHLYSNRSQWRSDPIFLAQVRVHFDDLIGDGDVTGVGNICDMNAYSEMRALVGGVTSILATHAVPCIHGLVRNLDFNSGFYGTTELNLERVVSAIEIPPASDPVGRAQFIGQAQFAIAFPFFEGLFLHVSEGVDAFSLEEFTFAQSQGLLCSKCVAIHGIALGKPQFQAMAAAGTSLVWSPRSNITLYGQTADINAALDAGVRVALAPDWAISGSANMLDELHFADQWNRTHLGGRLTDRELVDMVTRIPAAEAGVDDEVGAIRVGLRADLLIIDGDQNDALRGVIDGTPDDVQLMMIEGVPLYGDRNLMEQFWARSSLEEIALPNGPKTLASGAAGFVFSSVVGRLVPALTADGTSLAPLVEGGSSKHGKILTSFVGPSIHRRE
jgi:5-methylthioadenosine/S-adenosylhomocysteine deaminase